VYTNIPNWQATNDSTYTTTMTGNYMQSPESGQVTLSSSITFAGGTGVIGTSIRIVDSAGTVIATGATVTGNSGTATVTWTGTVRAGALYTVQGYNSLNAGFFGYGAGTTGTWGSGTFTLTSTQIPTTATVPVIPVPFEDQTPLTGPTTLYVMLASSDSTTQVSAGNDNPSMWIMPIPWV
jgi:hypothetical protein